MPHRGGHLPTFGVLRSLPCQNALHLMMGCWSPLENELYGIIQGLLVHLVRLLRLGLAFVWSTPMSLKSALGLG